ncbi:hypothetical protein [Malonomonas rubra]|uniref:hypothetical protein n=1 Tax=Malonomonas rubra TaxID=57040 RepID=UPI0026EAF0CA|nr:hypothetical protein [Malonomonas rubra]
MPVTFDTIDIKKIADNAARQTDAHLQGQISSLTRLTDDDIAAPFPQAQDAKKLVELMRIVRSIRSENGKILQRIDNSERFVGVVLNLV